MDSGQLENRCEDCANKDTMYCTICTPDDGFFMDEKTKAWNDMMCNMMCGGPEED